MKNPTFLKSILISTVLWLIFIGTAQAAPGVDPASTQALFFSEAVNLPGWFGGALAVLSVILPIVAFRWLKQK